MNTTVVDGLRIAYRRAGTGPTLLLLHGILQDSRAWRRQFDGLSDGFTVVAWDAPGCGRSDDPPESFRLPDYADCVAGFVRGLGLDRPHVLGVSLGATLALEVYRRHPSMPRSLVLSAGYAGWAGSLPADVVAERLERGLRESDRPPGEVIPGWIPGLFTDAAPQDVIEETVAMMSDFRPVGYRTMARGMAEADLRDVLPRINVPTLVLNGDVDRRSPLSVAEELHARIPGSSLLVLDGLGHLSNAEAPERCNAAVRGFLVGLDGDE